MEEKKNKKRLPFVREIWYNRHRKPCRAGYFAIRKDGNSECNPNTTFRSAS